MGKRTNFTQDEINSKIQRIYTLLLDERLPDYDCKNCDIEEMLSKVPTFPGLIVLCEEIDGKERIVFVGYSNNVHKRVKEYFFDLERNATLKRHIGYALLKKDGFKDDILTMWWNYENPTRLNNSDYMKIENEFSLKVLNYIKNHLSFKVIRVEDAGDRQTLSWRCLATLSWEKFKPTSECNWLGLNSEHDEVRNSGLWAIRTYYSKSIIQEEDFKLLEKLIKEVN